MIEVDGPVELMLEDKVLEMKMPPKQEPTVFENNEPGWTAELPFHFKLWVNFPEEVSCDYVGEARARVNLDKDEKLISHEFSYSTLTKVAGQVGKRIEELLTKLVDYGARREVTLHAPLLGYEKHRVYGSILSELIPAEEYDTELD